MWQSLFRNWVIREAMQAAAPPPSGDASEQVAGATAPLERPPRPVCHVGLVFALGIEAGGLVDQLSGVVRTDGHGFVAREGGLSGRRLVLLESGPGRKAAAKGATALVAGHQPRWLISAGFAGGLHQDLKQGDVLLANEIVGLDGQKLGIDLKLDPQSLSRSVHVGRLLTVDRIIRDPAEKRSLGEAHQALAVDMESLDVAEVCRREQVRFLSARVITDAVDRELPHDVDNLLKQKSTAGRIGAVTGAIWRRPSSLKDMWQLKEDALAASERLAKFLVGVIAQLDTENRVS